MLDIKFIRENAAKAKELLAKRNVDLSVIDDVLKLDAVWREQKTKAETKQASLNAASKGVGEWFGRLKKVANAAPGDEIVKALGRTPENPDEAKELLRVLGDEVNVLARVAEDRLKDIETRLLVVPNFPSDATPVGKDETGNVVRKTWGETPKFDFAPKPHWDIGAKFGMEMEVGGRISGSGFPFFRGPLARLERALINFYLDLHTRDHGYTECWVPYMVRGETLQNSGQLPKFIEEMYRLDDRDAGLFLIPTAEVPLTSYKAGEIVPHEQLPLRLTAFTPCFRREAGAAGKDTRGFQRVHQFNKVELMVVTRPDKSAEEHETLTRCAEHTLELLELPYRRLELCTGDMGFGATRCYDLEVFAPGMQKWLEVSSCSNFTDFQARRAKLRFRDENKKTELCHTLNGSGLACPRVMIGILENFQTKEGKVRLPKVLHHYYGSEWL
ncbi:MAG: serine--tRNA ligase [Planctomycetes bacterium]|nr:serine--tRNA ligase [Planctomycetota bacterium]